MFGVLASGRLVNTNVEQIDANSFSLCLEDVGSINHVVVFLTGQVPFSQDFGGAIYFGWPSVESGGIAWQFLGYICNAKPSAIFKLAKVKPPESTLSANPFSQHLTQSIASSLSSTTAQIGILVEPLAEILQKTTSQDTEASKVDTFTEFTQKMLENFFNYASSFAVSPAQSVLQPSAAYVPIDVLQNWYTNFQRRLQTNPNFWKNL